MPSRRRRNTRLSPSSPAFPSDFTTEICATAKAEPVQLVMHATEKGSKAVIVYGFGGVPLMLKEQILLHLPIVAVFSAICFGMATKRASQLFNFKLHGVEVGVYLHSFPVHLL